MDCGERLDISIGSATQAGQLITLDTVTEIKVRLYESAGAMVPYIAQ
jgi:hypothetical protein